MYATPPFHRRILPWIFAVTFCAAAPALVFYTAGYRWNPKKEKIERNGTLIIDSLPKDAEIFLNDKPTGETTPITLQNTPPGRYVVRVEKAGYFPWKKQLDVRGEYVTFANAIRLWKQASLVSHAFDATIPTKLLVAPNGKSLVLLSQDTSSSRLTMWQPPSDVRTAFTLPTRLSETATLSWSPDSRSVLIEDRNALVTHAWLLNTRQRNGVLPLSQGHYRWDANRLEGITMAERLIIDPLDGSVRKIPLPPGVTDEFHDIRLQHTSGTANLVLFDTTSPQEGFILPAGAWSIESVIDEYVLLRDDGDEWLSIDLASTRPRLYRARGQTMYPFSRNGNTEYLLINGGEVWHWNPRHDPELLIRDSEPMMAAAWHPEGHDIFLATATTLFALNLDPRDGRIRTTLASLEHVTSLSLLDGQLYLTGIHDGRTGLWSLTVE